ncbi:MAG TPA: PDZ domain-containing protein [Longimicrobium sp.]|nr:PDZ domain-containing protein [Longimicrobium sp.]
MRAAILLISLLLPVTAAAQDTVEYVLAVDSADLSGWTVEMRIPNAPSTVRLAMAAHPEYDDRFWRYVRGFTASTAAGPAEVVREDSMVWRVHSPGGALAVRYRIELPSLDEVRPSWTPFLAPTGGLVGGPHAWMYVLGAEAAPARVELRLPSGWDAATALESAGDGHRFTAPDVATLLDSPVLIGRLRRWSFSVDGVQHRVAYWPRPDAVSFDTVALVEALHGMAHQAGSMFGGLPYREFVFLLQDGAYGGLEHASSTTVGAPSGELAGDRADVLLSIAHEYFHAWNLVRLRPAGWGGLTHRPPGRTRELWFSEGVTMYYADVLQRRAGLVRTPRLEVLAAHVENYLENPGIGSVSPEQAGWMAEEGPEANDGLGGDHYLQGELTGAVLDLVIRNSTGGQRSLDDVMRWLLAEHPQPGGYTGADVERAASAVCGCDLSGFFARHVRGAERLDFDAAVRPLGLAARIRQEPVVDAEGRPQPDLRVWAYERPGETAPRLLVADPRSAWHRAGLRTHDAIVAMNGAAIPDRRAFITRFRALKVGDRVRLDVLRDGQPVTADFVMGGYERTRVEFIDLPTVTPTQRAAREKWLAAAP